MKGDCINAEILLQKKEINRLYKIIAAHVQPDERHELDSAQKAWIAYRDAMSQYLGSHFGISYPAAAEFYLNEVAKQAAELRGVVASRGFSDE